MIIWTLLLGLAKSLWDKFAFYIMTAGAVVTALGYVFLKGRAAGKRVYREKQQKINKAAVEKTEKVIQRIDAAGEAEKDKRMEKWYRD